MAVARMRTHFNERNDAHRHALDVSVLGKKKRGKEKNAKEGERKDSAFALEYAHPVHTQSMDWRCRRGREEKRSLKRRREDRKTGDIGAIKNLRSVSVLSG